jgi:hypothetical protein
LTVPILDFGFWILDYFAIQDPAPCGWNNSKIDVTTQPVWWQAPLATTLFSRFSPR